MERLTEKQQKVLSFIESRLAAGERPSQREIAGHFGLAQNAIYQLVGYLKDKGYLVDSGGHRGLRLSEDYLDEVRRRRGLPVVGRVAAGEPILAQENIEGYIDAGQMFGPVGDKFVLKVAGESMVDEGIMDGDYVVVEPGRVENGQIGVVLLDEEATLKRIYFQRGRIALKPANRSGGYKTRYIKRGDGPVRIIGRVTGCFKRL